MLYQLSYLPEPSSIACKGNAASALCQPSGGQTTRFSGSWVGISTIQPVLTGLDRALRSRLAVLVDESAYLTHRETRSAMLVKARGTIQSVGPAGDRDAAAGPRLPLSRLIHLLMLLQSARYPNARRLAEACGVSRRTIFRDLATLEAAGIRVDYLSDRQGYHVAGPGMLQPTPLEKSESLAILLLSRAGIDDPFGLPRLASSALARLTQALPPVVRDRLVSSSELLADDQAPQFAKDRLELYATILDSLGERKRMKVWSREIEPRDPLTATKLGVYRLTRLRECWALVGHSSFHGGVRMFRVPWLERLELTDEIYVIPPRFRLDRFLARSNRQDRDGSLERVVLRFSQSAALALRDAASAPDGVYQAGPGGSLELVLAVDSFDRILDWLTCYGDEVEVVEPQALRDRVTAWAGALARIHSRDKVEPASSPRQFQE